MKAWERLEEVIKWTGLSTHAFAMELGLKRSENLYRVRREKNGVSRKLAETIVQRYPEVNMLWLFTGEGQMFACEKITQPPKKQICVYENLNHLNDPIFSIESAMFSDCDLGVRIDSDAMSPSVPNGSFLFLKKIDNDSIIYGQMYYFLYKNVFMLRYIRKGTDENKIILSAVNSKRYDDMSINKNDISAIHLVNYLINKLI